MGFSLLDNEIINAAKESVKAKIVQIKYKKIAHAPFNGHAIRAPFRVYAL